MTNRQQEIKLHHEKWKKWKMQMKSQDNILKKQKQAKNVESAYNYAAKIIGQLQEPTKQKNHFSTQFQRQFQSNACSVCFELMIPPCRPFTLFPCGHNMCKICLFVNGSQNQKTYKLKTQNCSLCGQAISNYAQNRNLMNLICTYTNNKHLIQKEEDNILQEHIPDADIEVVDRLKLRCEILQKEKKSIGIALAKQRKSKQVLSEVLQKLSQEKNKSDQQLTTLKQQLKLIQSFLNQKRTELQKTKQRIKIVQQKKRVVQKTLEPIRTQKQKLQVLEAAKLLGK